jgi:pyruvate dehydrogenase E2 component (dihydrolipoamide acetyltransferase)
MAEFRMPALGADMDAGTVVEWLVAPGDTVHRGDVVAIVDTDKSAIDVECFDSGVVERLLVEPGTRVAVGTPLAVIAAQPGPGLTQTPFPPEQPSPVPPEPEPPLPPQPAPPPHVLSPLVRKLAAEGGLDLVTLHGTGCNGAITRADVEHALHPPTPTGPAPHRPRISPYARRLARERGLDLAVLIRPGRVLHARDLPAAPPVPPAITVPPAADPRAVTAALMARSKREIPHYYLAADLNVGPALEWLRGHNREIPVARRVLPAALLLRAVALAARDVPELNGHWLDGRFVPGDGVHLGIAVSLRGGGLAAPVVRDADTLALDDLMARMREAAERARTGRQRSSEIAGATITVTNLGDLGVDVVAGVIHPPQVALVGFGSVRPRPWVDGDTLVVRPVVTASLSADHRATDGATGARLLHAIDQHLRRPEALR